MPGWPPGPIVLHVTKIPAYSAIDTGAGRGAWWLTVIHSSIHLTDPHWGTNDAWDMVSPCLTGFSV